MFIGKYSLSIDSKGRLIVPAKFREVLASGYQASLILTMMDRCLVAYPIEEWVAIAERIRELPQMKRELKDFMRQVYSAAIECPIDRQGRILIPAEHRVYAGLGAGEAVVVGIMNKIEIWSRERWEAMQSATIERMDEIAHVLSEIGL
ncbi:MAG: division/cell wall cluster transcriptional repressor MraZ [Nitrospinota bacterium]